MRVKWVLMMIIFLIMIVFLYDPTPKTYTKEIKAGLNRIRKVMKRRKLERAEEAAREPEVLGTIRNLEASFLEAKNWEALLELGDVYRTGSFPTHRPNRSLASRIYKAACGAPDPRIAGLAQTRYVETRVDVIAGEDTAGVELPTRPGETCASAAVRLMMTTPSRGKPEVQQWEPEVHTEPEPPPVILTDAQNVHDHALTRGLHKALTDLPGGADALEEVAMRILESETTPSTKADAIEVLYTLGTADHSTLRISERRALDKVWARIKDLPETQREDASAILVTQLASGVEQGSVVCSTGKIARIMSTLDGITEDPPSLKPMWAIREELGTMAARLRDSPDPRKAFRDAATETYVRDLGMSQEVIGSLVDEFSVGFE